MAVRVLSSSANDAEILSVLNESHTQPNSNRANAQTRLRACHALRGVENRAGDKDIQP